MKKKAEGGGASSNFEVELYHEQIEAKVKVALLEQSIGHINQTLIRIEKRLDGFDNQFAVMGSEFKEIRRDMQSNFKWTIGMMISLTVFTISGLTGLASLMAHGFHWF